MRIEEAIKLAYPNQAEGAMFGGSQPNWQTYLMLPGFWQALGKSLGWKDPNPPRTYNYGHWRLEHDGGVTVDEKWHTEVVQWLFYWHAFIDHLSEGKTAESFFANIIP